MQDEQSFFKAELIAVHSYILLSARMKGSRDQQKLMTWENTTYSRDNRPFGAVISYIRT